MLQTLRACDARMCKNIVINNNNKSVNSLQMIGKDFSFKQLLQLNISSTLHHNTYILDYFIRKNIKYLWQYSSIRKYRSII